MPRILTSGPLDSYERVSGLGPRRPLLRLRILLLLLLFWPGLIKYPNTLCAYCAALMNIFTQQPFLRPLRNAKRPNALIARMTDTKGAMLSRAEQTGALLMALR